MSAPKPVNLTPTEAARIREYVLDRTVVDPVTGCWIWTMHKLHAGHGQGKLRGHPIKAHRLSYAAFREEPGELGVLHHCDNPPCACPQHLFLGTKGDNNKDAAAKGRYMLRPLAVLTDEMCQRAFLLRMEKKTVPAIAADLGVGYDVLRALLVGATHHHVIRPDGYEYKRDPALRGAKVGGAILTDDAVRDIRSSDEKQAEIAARLGVSQATVSHIRAGKSWKHVA